jgi:hypothetical protein
MGANSREHTDSISSSKPQREDSWIPSGSLGFPLENQGARGRARASALSAHFRRALCPELRLSPKLIMNVACLTGLLARSLNHCMSTATPPLKP